MGRIKKHPPVKLIIAFIFKEEEILHKAQDALISHFDAIDYQSKALPFTYTDYYETEFGKGLKRRFISFKKLISPRILPEIKITTNRIEKRLSNEGRRLINIDPGYIDMAKLILASTKDYRHRIYLNKGIYAEITLFYQNQTFAPWDWTYPDYKSTDYILIFNQIRNIYVTQV